MDTCSSMRAKITANVGSEKSGKKRREKWTIRCDIGPPLKRNRCVLYLYGLADSLHG